MGKKKWGGLGGREKGTLFLFFIFPSPINKRGDRNALFGVNRGFPKNGGIFLRWIFPVGEGVWKLKRLPEKMFPKKILQRVQRER